MNDDTEPKLNSQPKRIVVIGGGITGLSAAHRLMELQRNSTLSAELTLLEASDRVGGVFGTEKIGDYTVELGADSFITNKPWGVDLVDRLGLSDRMISTNPRYRRSLILHRGKPVPTPVGFNLLAPAKIWPMVTTPLLSPWGKLRAAQEYFIPAGKGQSDESLAEFVRRRFGQEMLDRIVQPMVGGIYTSDPEKLSLQATLPRFVELERRYGSVIRGLKKSSQREKQDEKASGARYGLFATPKAGMQELLHALVEAIRPDVELRLNQRVASIRNTPVGIEVEIANGSPIQADAIILALPAFQSADLLADIDSNLSNSLREIDYASSAIVVSGHKLSEIDHPLDAFGLVIPHCEGRRILAVSFLSRKFAGRAPDDSVILRTFVGGAMQPAEIDCSDEQVTETVLAELRDILGVRGEPDFVRVTRYNRAMPQYTVGHLDRVARIRSLVKSHPNLALAGNAYEGVGIPDSIHSGEQAADSIWKQVSIR